MVKKDYQLYGTKILNLKTQEIGLLICILQKSISNFKNELSDSLRVCISGFADGRHEVSPIKNGTNSLSTDKAK